MWLHNTVRNASDQYLFIKNACCRSFEVISGTIFKKDMTDTRQLYSPTFFQEEERSRGYPEAEALETASWWSPAHTLLNLNARSMLNKSADFEASVMEHDPGVTLVTEKWLSALLNDCEYLPLRYIAFRKFHGSRGGDVAIIAKEPFSCLPLPDSPNI